MITLGKVIVNDKGEKPPEGGFSSAQSDLTDRELMPDTQRQLRAC